MATERGAEHRFWLSKRAKRTSLTALLAAGNKRSMLRAFSFAYPINTLFLFYYFCIYHYSLKRVINDNVSCLIRCCFVFTLNYDCHKTKWVWFSFTANDLSKWQPKTCRARLLVVQESKANELDLLVSHFNYVRYYRILLYL